MAQEYQEEKLVTEGSYLLSYGLYEPMCSVLTWG